MKNAPLVLTLPDNEVGRDFVVGDIHTQYDLLFQSLNQLDFNPEKDRLFSVGDVINRGNENYKIMQLFKEPWFYSVLGNHELILLSYLNYYQSKYFNRLDYDYFRYVQWFSGKNSGQHLSIEKAKELILIVRNYISKLPNIIRIKKNDTWHYVVHADLSKAKNGYSVSNFNDEEIEILSKMTRNDLDWESFSFSERLFMESILLQKEDKKRSKFGHCLLRS